MERAVRVPRRPWCHRRLQAPAARANGAPAMGAERTLLLLMIKSREFMEKVGGASVGTGSVLPRDFEALRRP
jgi:hypothetical protein